MKKLLLIWLWVSIGLANTDFSPSEALQAGGEDIQVPGYSVPSLYDWNNDYLPDIIVGEGSGSHPAKVRVYINCGCGFSPEFDEFFYAQSNGSDLTGIGDSCLGVFPRMLKWNADNLPDLLVGHAGVQEGGLIKIYLNTNSVSRPAFDGGTTLQWGAVGAKQDITITDRPTPIVADWNSDGKKDLVMGHRNGKFYVFINEGTDSSPDFLTNITAKVGTQDIVLTGFRSSPDFFDLNQDGKKDLIGGDTSGKLWYFENTNSAINPIFAAAVPLTELGLPINLPGSNRARPFLCDWNLDMFTDMLVGYGDGGVDGYGKIHYFQGAPEPGMFLGLGLIFLAFFIRRN